MRRHARRAAALVVLLTLLACSSGDDDDVPADPATSPESLTEALMVLWQDRDRESADRLGTDAALDALFGVTPPDAALEVTTCVDDPALRGARTCSARGGGRTVLVTVRRLAESGSWRAVAVLPVR